MAAATAFVGQRIAVLVGGVSGSTLVVEGQTGALLKYLDPRVSNPAFDFHLAPTMVKAWTASGFDDSCEYTVTLAGTLANRGVAGVPMYALEIADFRVHAIYPQYTLPRVGAPSAASFQLPLPVLVKDMKRVAIQPERFTGRTLIMPVTFSKSDLDPSDKGGAFFRDRREAVEYHLPSEVIGPVLDRVFYSTDFWAIGRLNGQRSSRGEPQVHVERLVPRRSEVYEA